MEAFPKSPGTHGLVGAWQGDSYAAAVATERHDIGRWLNLDFEQGFQRAPGKGIDLQVAAAERRQSPLSHDRFGSWLNARCQLFWHKDGSSGAGQRYGLRLCPYHGVIGALLPTFHFRIR